MLLPPLPFVTGNSGQDLVISLNNLISQLNSTLQALAVTGVPRFGQVATGCYLPIAVTAGNRYIMSRTPHFIRDNVAAVSPNFSGFYVSQVTGQELGVGSTTSVTASIEYPAGTFTQCTFGGQVTGTIPNGGYLVADPCVVAIPRGAQFWVRRWSFSPAGIIYTNQTQVVNYSGGAVWKFSNSSLPDQTMSGTITPDGGAGFSPPIGIYAYTTRPSVALFGDSNQFGYGDTGNDSAACSDTGVIARAIGPHFAYTNFGVPSDQAAFFQATSTNRQALINTYHNSGVCHYGTNDLGTGGKTAAQIIPILQAIYNFFPGLTIFQTTVPPRTTSTDSWATTANQTVLGTEAQRVALNNAIRATIQGSEGYIDVSRVLETAYNSGIWNVTGAANGKTSDGIHANKSACFDLQNAGMIRYNAFASIYAGQ